MITANKTWLKPFYYAIFGRSVYRFTYINNRSQMWSFRTDSSEINVVYNSQLFFLKLFYQMQKKKQWLTWESRDKLIIDLNCLLEWILQTDVVHLNFDNYWTTHEWEDKDKLYSHIRVWYIQSMMK